jgi:hypothetical protein
MQIACLVYQAAPAGIISMAPLVIGSSSIGALLDYQRSRLL